MSGVDICTCVHPAILSLWQYERKQTLGSKLRVVKLCMQVCSTAQPGYKEI
jgi:hypothetical protein